MTQFDMCEFMHQVIALSGYSVRGVENNRENSF